MKSFRINSSLFVIIVSFFLSVVFIPQNFGVDSMPVAGTASYKMPPAWAFGIIYQTNSPQNEILSLIQKMNEAEYPIDAVWLNTVKAPNQSIPSHDKMMYRELEKLNIKPILCTGDMGQTGHWDSKDKTLRECILAPTNNSPDPKVPAVQWMPVALHSPDSWNLLKECINHLCDPAELSCQIPFLTFVPSLPEKGIDAEIFLRFIQFAAFSPLMVVNSPLNGTPAENENFQLYSHLRMQLFPYIYSCALQAQVTKSRMIKGDAEHPCQYMIGDQILVAPIYQKGIMAQDVYLPEGQWIDYWTSDLHQGGQLFPYNVTLNRIPLFVKAGSILPMRKYAKSVEAGSNQNLVLDIYPQGMSSMLLYEDDGTTNGYLQSQYASTRFTCHRSRDDMNLMIEPPVGSYKNMPTSRDYYLIVRDPIYPQIISVNDKQLNYYYFDKFEKNQSGWYFDKGKKETYVKFKASTQKQTTIRFQIY